MYTLDNVTFTGQLTGEFSNKYIISVTCNKTNEVLMTYPITHNHTIKFGELDFLLKEEYLQNFMLRVVNHKYGDQ